VAPPDDNLVGAEGFRHAVVPTGLQAENIGVWDVLRIHREPQNQLHR
jgi:hypothetical protein